jgi:hypothetical protein
MGGGQQQVAVPSGAKSPRFIWLWMARLNVAPFPVAPCLIVRFLKH